MNYTWKNRSVVITGGAGCIGSILAKRLVQEGANVKILDNLERGALEFITPFIDKVDFHQMDLRNLEETRDCLKGSEVVFHLASKVGGIKVYLNHPGDILNNNLLIDQNVFKAIIEHRIPSVFYASSAHVYPEDRQQTPDSSPLTEDEAYPANPGLSYGWGKLIGEQTLEGFAQEHPWLRVSIARIVGAYGYNQDIGLETGSVIPVLCHRALRANRREAIPLWGTGEETRSYCFIDDVVDAILRSISAQKNHSIVGPFSLGQEGRVTIKTIAEHIIKIADKDLTLSFDLSVKTTLWGQAVTCTLAKQLLYDWVPNTSFEEGLKKTYEHVKTRLPNET